jgi:hypothetical protein
MNRKLLALSTALAGAAGLLLLHAADPAADRLRSLGKA